MPQIIMDHLASGCFGTSLAPKNECADTKLPQAAQAMPAAQPTPTEKDRNLWRLCRGFGAHALTRVRTPSAQLGALLHHLILSCYLHAVFRALPANISAENAYSFVKR
jgi:hypothetical protein